MNFLKDPVRSQLIENEYEKSLERAFDEAAASLADVQGFWSSEAV